MEESKFKKVQKQLAILGLTARAIEGLDEFLIIADEAITMGPLLDPTKCQGDWMQNSSEWERLGEAAKQFRTQISDINLGENEQKQTLSGFLKMIEETAKFDDDDSGEVLECKLEQIENFTATIRTMLALD